MVKENHTGNLPPLLCDPVLMPTVGTCHSNPHKTYWFEESLLFFFLSSENQFQEMLTFYTGEN